MTDGGGSRVVQCRLPSDDTAPSVARGLARDLLRGIPDDVRDSYLLIVSELVTNAMDHGRPPIDLYLSVLPVRIEVRDVSRQMPIQRSPPPSSTRGRGLLIVAELAASWGSHSTRSGKVVWATL